MKHTQRHNQQEELISVENTYKIKDAKLNNIDTIEQYHSYPIIIHPIKETMNFIEIMTYDNSDDIEDLYNMANNLLELSVILVQNSYEAGKFIVNNSTKLVNYSIDTINFARDNFSKNNSHDGMIIEESYNYITEPHVCIHDDLMMGMTMSESPKQYDDDLIA